MTDPDFPALSRLTEQVDAAMRAAEQRAPWWRRAPRSGLLAILALVTVVPAAVAVHLVTRTEVTFPGIEPGQPPKSAFVVARGHANGLVWTLAITRCERRGVVTLLPATLIERKLGEGGGGYTPCPSGRSDRPPRPQPLLLVTAQSAPPKLGLNWGVVASAVASVELRIADRSVRVNTQPFDPSGAKQGRLPDGHRYFVIVRRDAAIYTRAIARTARGTIVRNCTRRQCDSLARRGR